MNPNARRVPFSSLVYNKGAARYVNEKGRFISTGAVRDIIDNDISAAGARMVEHGAKLKDAAQLFKDGALSQEQYTAAVRDWRNDMAASVKAANLGQGAAACGGFHNMTQARYGAIGGALKKQYAYLSNFAIEAAANPDIVLSLDKSRRPFDERIAAYSEASRETFEALQYSEMVDAGFQAMQNDLEPSAHHCTGEKSCPAMTAMGRVAIRDARYLRVGKRKCSFKCKCKTRYFKARAENTA